VKQALSARHAFLALLVVAIWGSNFTVAKVVMETFPPLFMACLRFLLVFFPLAFVLGWPRPASWRNVALYGLAVGVGQFGLIFIAMDGWISPGLASLVIQMQVFFTIGLSLWRSGESVRAHQVAAFAIALAGMAVIMAHNEKGATAIGVLMCLGAALFWAVGNQASKEAGRINALSYVAWSSLFAAPPLLALSLEMEGWPAIARGLSHAGAWVWLAMLWQSFGNTLFGFGCWAWLLSRYPAATVAPMSLLVPLFGFATSALWLGEPIQTWKIAATLLVLSGLAVNLFWARLKPPVRSSP
jgi:O-acetylserine/cysteine efflux transporter